MRRGGGRRWLAALTALPVIALAAGPTPALADQNAGTGTLSGTISFAPNMGVPLTGCNATSWSMGLGTGGTVTAQLPGQQYTGPITASGGGGSSCAFASQEGGNLSVVANQLSTAVGDFYCSVGGSYLRLATHVLVFVQGNCRVTAATSTNPVWFIANAEFLPLTPQTSSSGAIQTQLAAFVAHFVIYPAN